jgi:hypothetical protein
MAISSKRVFISYLNDNDSKTEGYCELLEETANYVKIKSGSNILTIPYHRILKIKEALE